MTNLFSSKPLSELTIDELYKKEKFLSTAKKVMIAVMILATVGTLIRIYLKAHFPGDSGLLIMSLLLSALVTANQKKVTDEINSRAESKSN
ncbi:hypothetical protein GCM10023189_14100 [Nibrella saemangeumensis]|uniref:Uncharacterized protein n=1 Tax=Nibrella saemangeumensis TaxID=1084526 RepID=A0ABP8MJK7_9BACT